MAEPMPSPYHWRNILDKSPNTISTTIFLAIQFVMSVVFYFTHFDPDGKALALVMTGEGVLTMGLNLFITQAKTVTNQQAAVQQEAVKQQTTADIAKFLVAAEPPVDDGLVQDVVEGKPAEEAEAAAAAKKAVAAKKAAK